ncbi:hypothetical protein [Vibrio vulnificus]|uniref:hypothetical protein n=1 Tax=Vibrio vulnificus TaxID=672 RepID=UPI00102C542E|nr:hypothetical protein [Vibrio vulnificus]RZR09490.1 hypothetical protein D8T44_20795 [Vibrio vulnificus]
MDINLKHYIESAFSDLIPAPSESNSKSLKNEKLITKFEQLQTAKDKTRSKFASEEELAALYDPLEMSHLLDLFLWPCNAFAVCASLIKEHGDYRLLISGESGVVWTTEDREEVERLGSLWEKFINANVNDLNLIKLDEINELLLSVFEHKNQNLSISKLKSDPQFKKNLLKVCLCADESFRNISVLNPLADTVAGRVAEQLNIISDAHSYQLAMTNSSFGSVHYKNSVCQSGISINSISSKLALISPEIKLKYIERPTDSKHEKRDNYNILILPWPLKVHRTDFQAVNKNNLLEMDHNFGFFSYLPKDELSRQELEEVLKKYYLEFDEVDLIVLPECAVESSKADELFETIESYCKKHSKYCPTFITGVFKQGDASNYGINSLKLYTTSSLYGLEGESCDSAEQHKHHRWFLDRPQLHNYKLGNRLSPKKKWWEYSKVDERSLISYYCQQNDLQLSPLICEDLARQDPVAPVIRSLGPNLIVALLLDGAQIKNRWPGRYASLLSEDPGSSVLTISPLGMTERSDGTGFPPSRTVAFWSEPDGSYKELSLDKERTSIVLTLEPSTLTQWTADGRKSEKKVLNYAGHISI